MPRGGSRPGSGRKRKPVEDHLRAGTFRPSRHGPRPTNVLPMPVPVAGWEPAEADLETLEASGRAFVASMLERYELAWIDGVLLLEAGHAVDEIARWREPVTDAHEAQARSRLVLNWQKQLAALLHALKGSTA